MDSSTCRKGKKEKKKKPFNLFDNLNNLDQDSTLYACNSKKIITIIINKENHCDFYIFLFDKIRLLGQSYI